MPPPRPIVHLLCLLLLGSSAEAAPQRVMSVNLCTDQYLMLVADPAQIASVSHLAFDPAISFMAAEAAHHPQNPGTAEEALGLRPDLILSSQYSSPSLTAMLERLGFRVERFPVATDEAGILANLGRIGRLLGREQRAAALADEFRRRIAAATATGPLPTTTALFYQPGGYTAGAATLQDTALRLAGLVNLAARLGYQGHGVIDLETIALHPPDRLVVSRDGAAGASRLEAELHHPVMRAITQGRPMQEIDYRYWICDGPMLADAVEALAGER